MPWYDCINFAPCNCVAYFFNTSIPVAPVERSINLIRGVKRDWGRDYRCLICGAVWDDEWLEEQKNEVYKGKA